MKSSAINYHRTYINIAHRNFVVMRLPRFAGLERRLSVSFPSRTNFAAAGTNNCIRDCDSRRCRGQVPEPYASEIRFRRVRARRQRKGEKVTTAEKEGRSGGAHREKGKRDIRRSKALGFLRCGQRQARGNLRYAANVSLPGSVHRQLPNFE